MEQAQSSGSMTVTATESERAAAAQTINRVLVLHLKAKKRTVKWAEETVDNEFMGKKSSKRCCIFHKKKAFAESDSEETDSDNELGLNKKGEKIKNYQRFHA